MKSKIISQGVGLISPTTMTSAPTRMEASSSGYNLAHSNTAPSFLSSADDNNPLILDDEDNSESFDEDLGAADWRMDDFTPGASRSTSFYRGFFDSTHERLSASGILKRPFQTGLCITLALGFICGVLGLFLGGLIASWNEKSCLTSLSSAEKWQQQFSKIVSQKSSTNKHSESMWTSLFNNSTAEVDFAALGDAIYKLGAWQSVSIETIDPMFWHLPVSSQMSFPNMDQKNGKDQVTRILSMQPSAVVHKPYYYGRLEDVGDCNVLTPNIIRNFSTSTILLCGLSSPVHSIPLLANPAVQLILIFNRSSSLVRRDISTTNQNKLESQSADARKSIQPFSSFSHFSLSNLPVPYIIVSEAIPSIFYDDEIKISVDSKTLKMSSTFLKTFIKGSTFTDEVLVIGASTSSYHSMVLTHKLLSHLKSLQQKGWQPLRTILVLIWDGNVMSLEKWIESHQELLFFRMKTFVDITDPIQGRGTFSASGTMALKQVIFLATKMVMSNYKNSYTIYDRWSQCMPQMLPFNYSVPKMKYPRSGTAARMVQETTNSAVISLQYQNTHHSQFRSVGSKTTCEGLTQDEFTSSSSSSQSDETDQFLSSLSEVVIRMLLLMSNDPILPFNMVDVAQSVKSALTGNEDSEVDNLIEKLQIEATHIHAFLDFTVPTDTISVEETRTLNKRLYSSSTSLEKILIRYGEQLERLSEMSKLVELEKKEQTSAQKPNNNNNNSNRIFVSVCAHVSNSIQTFQKSIKYTLKSALHLLTGTDSF